MFISKKAVSRFKHIEITTIIIIFLLSLFLLGNVLSQKSATVALRDYVQEAIPEDAIVVIDPRIYNGIHAWVFNDKYYVDGTYLYQVIENANSLSSQKANIPLYYIECGKGTTCGWKEEDYQRVSIFAESLAQYFHENLEKTTEIKVDHTFLVYNGVIQLPPVAYDIIDQTHLFWFQSIGWKYPEANADEYTVGGSMKILESLGFLILYLDVLLALLSIPLTIYLVNRQEENNHP